MRAGIDAGNRPVVPHYCLQTFGGNEMCSNDNRFWFRFEFVQKH